MRIQVLEHTLTYTEHNHIDEFIQQIEEIAVKQDLHISHMIINDKEVYDDISDYISKHHDETELVQIILKSKKQLTDDVLNSTHTYLIQALPGIDELANLFYRKDTNKVWTSFGDLVDGMQWIMTLVNSLIDSEVQYVNKSTYLNMLGQLKDTLSSMEEPLQYKDQQLMGDILLHELIPLLNELKGHIQTTMDNGVHSI